MSTRSDDIAISALMAFFILCFATLIYALGYFAYTRVGVWALPAIAVFLIVWAAVYAFVRNERP